MSRTTTWSGMAALALCALGTPARAIHNSVPGIQGDVSRSLLGDGTGVVIGIIDSGIDSTHPALAGLDSLGNSRLVAQANFVTSEPANTGDDVFGHGTWAASAALSSDATFRGMAPDARYVNARVLDNNNNFSSDVTVRNGIGYAIDRGANILNLSLNFFSPNSSGNSQIDLMLDWAAFARGISTTISAGNISTGNGTTMVRGPASAYNGVAVGRTIADLSKVSIDSAGAFTADGRMKPDVVAPGTLLTLANDDWEGAAADWDTGLNGTSFAAPHVAGMMAQVIEAGTQRGWSTSPLVVKASIMNSAVKNVLNRDFDPWAPANSQLVGDVINVTQPLDAHSGAGLINGLALANQYLAGEQAPGMVNPIGWDLHTIGVGQSIDYIIDPKLIQGSTLSASLTWHRHVNRVDNGNGIIDAGDSFSLLKTLSNLNLQLFEGGNLIAQSISGLDNVEHLFLDIQRTAQYTLRVVGANVTGGSEQFALAWYGVAVPEPASAVLLLAALAQLMTRQRVRRRC